jgi:hypothetical protein
MLWNCLLICLGLDRLVSSIQVMLDFGIRNALKNGMAMGGKL